MSGRRWHFYAPSAAGLIYSYLTSPPPIYDMESEEQFNEFIESSLDYNFVFIITHRKEILDKVDKILTVHDGLVDIS